MMPILLLFFGLGVAGVPMTQTIAPEARLLGIVDFGSERTKDVVTAPDAVRVNEDFKVTITTFGRGCERDQCGHYGDRSIGHDL